MVIIAYWAERKGTKPIEMCGVFEDREAYNRFKALEAHRGILINGGAMLFVDETKTVAQWLDEQRQKGLW